MATKLKKLPPDRVVEDVKQSVLREFRQIPGVGKRIAEDLWNLDLRSVSDLKNQDPEDLYLKLCALQGTHVDRRKGDALDFALSRAPNCALAVDC